MVNFLGFLGDMEVEGWPLPKLLHVSLHLKHRTNSVP